MGTFLCSLLCFIELFIFINIRDYIDYYILKYILNSGTFSLPILLFLFKVVMHILGLFYFHVDFRINSLGDCVVSIDQ